VSYLYWWLFVAELLIAAVLLVRPEKERDE
jgi:hypothetical protein